MLEMFDICTAQQSSQQLHMATETSKLSSNFNALSSNFNHMWLVAAILDSAGNHAAG